MCQGPLLSLCHFSYADSVPLLNISTTAAMQHLKLVHIDPNSNHTLVLGLNRQSNIPVPSSISAKKDKNEEPKSKRLSFNAESFNVEPFPIFSLVYVKYEFYPSPSSSLPSSSLDRNSNWPYSSTKLPLTAQSGNRNPMSVSSLSGASASTGSASALKGALVTAQHKIHPKQRGNPPLPLNTPLVQTQQWSQAGHHTNAHSQQHTQQPHAQQMMFYQQTQPIQCMTPIPAFFCTLSLSIT
jgi:hypothetical protein